MLHLWLFLQRSLSPLNCDSYSGFDTNWNDNIDYFLGKLNFRSENSVSAGCPLLCKAVSVQGLLEKLNLVSTAPSRAYKGKEQCINRVTANLQLFQYQAIAKISQWTKKHTGVMNFWHGNERFNYTFRADEVMNSDKHSAVFLWYLKKLLSSTSLLIRPVIMSLWNCVSYFL